MFSLYDGEPQSLANYCSSLLCKVLSGTSKNAKFVFLQTLSLEDRDLYRSLTSALLSSRLKNGVIAQNTATELSGSCLQKLTSWPGGGYKRREKKSQHRLYSLLIVPITKHHKPGSLKQHKVIDLIVWEGRRTKQVSQFKSKVSAGLYSFRRRWGGPFPCLSQSLKVLRLLGPWPLLHPQRASL